MVLDAAWDHDVKNLFKGFISILFWFLMICSFQNAYAEPKIFMVKKEDWSHPVEQIFNRYDISLYKVYYSKDGTCPTFYARFKHPPAAKTSPLNYQKIYSELLKANSNYPYALVDKEDNVKINVGWQEEGRKTMVVDVGKANTPTACKGNSHAHIDDEADYDPFNISSDMKARILKSPYKALLKKADGRKFMAYLYAQKTKNYMRQDPDEMEKFTKTKKLVGQYYIYLYDIEAGSFFPGRVKIFNKFYTSIMNGKGYEFFSLSTANEKNSDILLVSQYVLSKIYDYEVYGFSEDRNFLKKYIFLTQEQETMGKFCGIIDKEIINGRFFGYDFSNKHHSILYLSATPGVIEVKSRDSVAWSSRSNGLS